MINNWHPVKKKLCTPQKVTFVYLIKYKNSAQEFFQKMVLSYTLKYNI